MTARNSILNALLSLAVAIEFVFELGFRFGTWFRNGGDQQIRSAIVHAIAAAFWLGATVRLGCDVIYRNRITIMETVGKPFICTEPIL